MVTGTDFEWLESLRVPVLVIADMDGRFEFNLGLDLVDLGCESIEEWNVESDSVPVEIMYHRETVSVHPGNIVRVWEIGVMDAAE